MTKKSKEKLDLPTDEGVKKESVKTEKIALSVVQTDKWNKSTQEETILKQKLQEVQSKKNDLIEMFLDSAGVSVKDMAKIVNVDFEVAENNQLMLKYVIKG